MHMLIFLLIVLKYMSDKTAFLLYFKHGETANPSYLQKRGSFHSTIVNTDTAIVMSIILEEKNSQIIPVKPQWHALHE